MTLVHQHLPQLGDQVIMIPTNAPHVALPTAPPRKRIFPTEHRTEIPDFKRMKPFPGVKINEKPSRENAYHNGYPSSEIDRYYSKESIVNNWFYPAPDRQLKAKLLS